jgi:hypothetical protein
LLAAVVVVQQVGEVPMGIEPQKAVVLEAKVLLAETLQPTPYM